MIRHRVAEFAFAFVPAPLAVAVAAAVSVVAGGGGCAYTPPSVEAPLALAGVAHREFNRASLELALPLFWNDDKNHDGAIDASELTILWGIDPRPPTYWIAEGKLTLAAREAIERIGAAARTPMTAGSARGNAPGHASGDASGEARRQALARELAQSTFSVIDTDFSAAMDEDRTVVRHVVDAARLIERLYARQLGTFGMEARIPPADTRARLIFYLNQGPWCSAPLTEKDPSCSAIDPAPERRSGLYPADLQADKGFCERLAKHPQHEQLLSPFTVVARDQQGRLQAVPYAVAYKDDMAAISREIAAAAGAIKSPAEASFKAYLRAAANAFTDDSWFAADEAWAKMTGEGSKWYLRIGPDEVYFDPCNVKAGFHVSFGRIDTAALGWQKKLDPVKDEMERTLATMAGPPYVAREVSFHLPDFVEIVLNAGDSRSARGAALGQSLPNFGPVADEGRGRTVVMTNLYTDADSRAMWRHHAEAMLCAATMARYTDDTDATLLGAVLHEAAHNLGPASEYKVSGKSDTVLFGGPLASMLEELKAQSSALFLVGWLAEKSMITREAAQHVLVHELAWALGHLGAGVYEANGRMKPYGALAAIQIGSLLDRGALLWRTDTTAANGADKGCFDLEDTKVPSALAALEESVLRIKARGDVTAATGLKKQYLDGAGPFKAVAAAVAQRSQRFPRVSFLYAVRQ